MKSIFISITCLFLGHCQMLCAQDLDTPDKKEIYKTIMLVGKAWTQNNLDTLNKYIDANYVHSDVTGQILNRAQWLNYVKDRKVKGLTNPTIEFDDVEISVYTDFAIVTGINAFTGQAFTANDNSNNKVRKLRFTQVLIREGQIWKRRAFQATYIDNP